MIFMLNALNVLANCNADKLQPLILNWTVSLPMEVEASALVGRDQRLPKYV